MRSEFCQFPLSSVIFETLNVIKISTSLKCSCGWKFFKNSTLQTIAENCIHIKHLVLVFGNSFTSSYAMDYQWRQDVYMENLHNWIKLNIKMLNKRGKIENCIRDTMGYECVCADGLNLIRAEHAEDYWWPLVVN